MTYKLAAKTRKRATRMFWVGILVGIVATIFLALNAILHWNLTVYGMLCLPVSWLFYMLGRYLDERTDAMLAEIRKQEQI